MLKSIKFIKPVAPYNAGEIAGFDVKVADGYIERDLAVAVGEAPTPSAPAPEQEPASGEIPEGWREFNAAETVALARALGAGDEIKTKAAAAELIDAELAKRDSGAA